MRLPQFAETFALAKRSDFVVMGVGNVSHTSLIWSGYLDNRGLAWAKNHGAIGHMCGQFFDEAGAVLPISINKRSITIGLKALRSIERVVAIAAGSHKASAIVGALRGKYCGVLVVDAAAAEAVLNQNAKNKLSALQR